MSYCHSKRRRLQSSVTVVMIKALERSEPKGKRQQGVVLSQQKKEAAIKCNGGYDKSIGKK